MVISSGRRLTGPVGGHGAQQPEDPGKNGHQAGRGHHRRRPEPDQFEGDFDFLGERRRVSPVGMIPKAMVDPAATLATARPPADEVEGDHHPRPHPGRQGRRRDGAAPTTAAATSTGSQPRRPGLDREQSAQAGE